jgi:secondary thiamine-phosphate synthase enzyme
MEIYSASIQITTNGNCDVIDLTSYIKKSLTSSKIINGLVTIFAPGSTAGVTTMEFENGVVTDFKKAIERLIPKNINYEHDSRWGDGNGFSHIRAALIGPSLTIPISEGLLTLGAWQQIVLVDFDNRARTREILV